MSQQLEPEDELLLSVQRRMRGPTLILALLAAFALALCVYHPLTGGSVMLLLG